MENLKPGLTGKSTIIVRKEDLATNYGNPGVDVLATPKVVSLIEEAAVNAVSRILPEGSVSVGTWLEIFHQSPTPEGMRVTVEAKLVSVEERKLTFEITVQDETGKVAESGHERFIVNRERFMNKASLKKA